MISNMSLVSDLHKTEEFNPNLTSSLNFCITSRQLREEVLKGSKATCQESD